MIMIARIVESKDRKTALVYMPLGGTDRFLAYRFDPAEGYDCVGEVSREFIDVLSLTKDRDTGKKIAKLVDLGKSSYMWDVRIWNLLD
jgi:hypothetical protein